MSKDVARTLVVYNLLRVDLLHQAHLVKKKPSLGHLSEAD